MVNNPEDRSVIDRCIRSFIIKSIHAIVQSRNGLLCKTACLSDVGSRNNMMLNIEEDPDVSASIKQSLDSGFQMKVGDVISLEIIQIKSLNVYEVWQFRLDSLENLDNKPPFSEAAPGNIVDQNCQVQMSKEDMGQSRLIERLGTLLKSLWVILRLLPVYRFCRKNDEVFGYVVQRGDVKSDKLGKNIISKRIGRLNSGLEMCTLSGQKIVVPNNSPTKDSQIDPNKTIFIDIFVHYRSNLDDVKNCIVPKLNKLSIKPAFVYVDEKDETDESYDEQRDYFPNENRIYSNMHANSNQGIDSSLSEDHTSDDSCDKSDECLSNKKKQPVQPKDNITQQTPPTADPVPLSLPFSDCSVTTSSHFTNLYNQLRDRNDFEIFQVPKNVHGYSSNLSPDFMNEELERHEKTLKEFDDFLSGILNQ